METKRNKAMPAPAVPRRATGKRDRILAVGVRVDEIEFVSRQLFGALSGESVPIPFDDLADADRLNEAVAVVSPLVGAGFDILDVAVALSQAGFDGQYIAFTHGLPSPEIVRREVQSAAPMLRFEIIEMDGGPRLT